MGRCTPDSSRKIYFHVQIWLLLESIWTWFSFFFFFHQFNLKWDWKLSDQIGSYNLEAVYGLLNRFGIQVQSLYSYVFQFSNLIITWVRILIGIYIYVSVCVRGSLLARGYIMHQMHGIYIYIFPLAKALLWQAYKILNPMQNFWRKLLEISYFMCQIRLKWEHLISAELEERVSCGNKRGGWGFYVGVLLELKWRKAK